MRRNYMKQTMRFVILTVLACAGATAAAAAETRSGEQLFSAFGCVLCHGATGHRGGVAGQPIAPLQHDLDAFRVLVRTPARAMPAFAPEALSEEQLQKLYEFLRAVPASPEVADLPLLKNFPATPAQ
jgi:mono/diheme cytochrome c family protein